MKKDAYYFSHDSNSKDDPKCVLLIEQLGLEGYGIFWVLIETLREQPNYKYPIILLPAIARRFNTSTEKVKAVVFNYQLFIIENDELFFSESLINRMVSLEENRIKRSLAGKKGNALRWNNDNKSIAKVSQCDRNASLVKEIKEDKIKEENIIVDNLQSAKKTIENSSSFEAILMQMRFTKETGLKFLNEFIAGQELSKQYLGKPESEIISHFINWLKKQKNTETNATTNQLNQNYTPKQRMVY